MALFDFKGKAAAEAWKSDLADLNMRTDVALKDIANTIEEIKLESTGDPVDALVETSAAMAAAAVEVINGLKGLEQAIQDIINILIQLISDATQDVADDRSKATDL